MNIPEVPLITNLMGDELIKERYRRIIGFKGDYPYIAPFVYVFDDTYINFLSTKDGKKFKYLSKER
jgi:uncharacterized protein